MSTRTNKARKRPAKKQSRGATDGSGSALLQKTVSVALQKKPIGNQLVATRSVSGKATSALLLAASAASPERKPSRAVAEAGGLAKRDPVMSADPGAASGAETFEGKAESVIDQNFKLWLAMLRMSPFSLVLHQQAAIARMILRFMLTSKPVR